jgi:dienelactone hydrolase
MRRLLASLVVICAACSGSSTSGNGDGNGSGGDARPVEVVADISYAPGLTADLYLAEDPGDRPAIVWIHGGGFITGHKGQLANLATEFARRGYPGLSIEYRLSSGGEAWFPAADFTDPGLRRAAAAATDDALAAAGWLLSEGAERWPVGGGAVVLAGYSAGGITAVEGAIRAASRDDDLPIAGAVSLAGAGISLGQIDESTPPLHFVHGQLDDVIPAALAQATCRNAPACSVDVRPAQGHILVQADLIASTAMFLDTLR